MSPEAELAPAPAELDAEDGATMEVSFVAWPGHETPEARRALFEAVQGLQGSWSKRSEAAIPSAAPGDAALRVWFRKFRPGRAQLTLQAMENASEDSGWCG